MLAAMSWTNCWRVKIPKRNARIASAQLAAPSLSWRGRWRFNG
ncbi:Uncharacterised protein [Shimwellia blattae]|nr:Uncharacterised protein [Shimwellia blattae]VEC28543.1 Uncharacterised protein [Shimwellia blattae]